MAHHASAEKRIRQRDKRRVRNRLILVTVRTYVKRLRAAIAEGNAETARSLLRDAVSKLDRAATKGVLHRGTTARTISRLSRSVASLS